MNAIQAREASIYNRSEIADADVCGCYSCVSTFPGKSVEKWCDYGGTALCPLCGVDAVLPGVNDTQELENLHKKWFADSNG